MSDERKGRGRWAKRLDRSLLPFLGPAQIGAGHPEEPYRVPTDAACPICGTPMAGHEIIRAADQTHPTRLRCPRPS